MTTDKEQDKGHGGIGRRGLGLSYWGRCWMWMWAGAVPVPVSAVEWWVQRQRLRLRGRGEKHSSHLVLVLESSMHNTGTKAIAKHVQGRLCGYTHIHTHLALLLKGETRSGGE